MLRRLAATARHFPRASAMSSAVSPSSQNDALLVRKSANGRILTLNRPKAFNALNLPLIRSLTSYILNYATSPLASVIILRTQHPKAFCAGGDVREILCLAQEHHPDAIRFFLEEYQLNHALGTIPKPIVAMMDGITMGGGVGISVHAPFRIATEKTIFSMPETKIGLFPDVGGSYFLPRLDGNLGYYLALTGAQLKGVDVLRAGIATHFVPSERLDDLEKRLCELDNADPLMIDSAIEEFSGDIDGVDSHGTWSLGGEIREKIDTIFDATSLHDILARLKKHANQGDTWCQAQLDTLNAMSPTSMLITLHLLKNGANASFTDCFKNEFQLVQHVLSAKADFFEGVDALLNSKPPRPAHWHPATVEAMNEEAILQQYFGAAVKEELVLPSPLWRDYQQNQQGGRIVELHTETIHRNQFALPSEKQVLSIIAGQHPGSGAMQWTLPEVVEWFQRERNGKQWVAQHVMEICLRKCNVDPQGGFLSLKK